MTKTATQRDVTRIRNLAVHAMAVVRNGPLNEQTSYFNDVLKEIVALAEAIDARTGRRDPSVRKSSSRGVRKSAKRARATQ